MPSFDDFCRWFPTLHQYFGVHKSITELDLVDFLKSPAVTSGSGVAARFCLAIWNSYNYDFNLKEIASWDDVHLCAFQKWAREPFWY